MKIEAIINNNLKLIVESESKSECIEVMKSFLPTPQSAVVKKVEAANPRPLTADDYIKSHSSYSATVPGGSAPPKKRLVFFKCPECGTTACSYTDEVVATCYSCQCKVSLDDLSDGVYECDCGRTAKFKLTNNVCEVFCKDCRSKILIDYDSDAKCYKPI